MPKSIHTHVDDPRQAGNNYNPAQPSTPTQSTHGQPDPGKPPNHTLHGRRSPTRRVLTLPLASPPPAPATPAQPPCDAAKNEYLDPPHQPVRPGRRKPNIHLHQRRERHRHQHDRQAADLDRWCRPGLAHPRTLAAQQGGLPCPDQPKHPTAGPDHRTPRRSRQALPHHLRPPHAPRYWSVTLTIHASGDIIGSRNQLRAQGEATTWRLFLHRSPASGASAGLRTSSALLAWLP